MDLVVECQKVAKLDREVDHTFSILSVDGFQDKKIGSDFKMSIVVICNVERKQRSFTFQRYKPKMRK